MKSKKIKDERVTQLNNKIQSEAYSIVIFIASISIVIKSYILDMDFTQYLFELGIVIISVGYVALRSMFLGYNFMDFSKYKERLTVIIIIIMSLLISVINGIRNYSLYGDKYTGVLDGHFIAVIAVMFISSFIFISVPFALLYWFNAKGQQKIEKKLQEDEE